MRLSIWDSAVWLLLITGTLLGVSLPFGKLSAAAGVAPVIWAFVISFGAGTVLLVALLARGEARWPNAAKLRYFIVTAAISYAFPNLLIMSAIPHLGAGFTGIMFTLSPVITLTLSVLLGMRRPSALGIAGIIVGFAGSRVRWSSRSRAARREGLRKRSGSSSGSPSPSALPAATSTARSTGRKMPGRSSLPPAAILLRRRC